MYLPILRGRQFELIALRELVENKLLSRRVIPIVEPVKISSTLIKTMQIFQNRNRQFSIIRNPQVSKFVADLKEDKNVKLKEQLFELMKLDNVFLNAYYITQAAERYVEERIKKETDISNIITICQNKDNIPVFEAIFSNVNPRYCLIPDESVFRRRIKNNRVIMADKFNKQSRNIDYAERDDESFSDDHLYYIDDKYIGFSDYSIIGDEYSEKGFAPYAVAIHIVYFDREKSLRIKHFVSDSNDDISDPAGKFSEALKKLVDWNKDEQLNTYGIKELEDLYEKEKYPGLGTVKKLSLMHHLELMSRFLDEDGGA